MLSLVPRRQSIERANREAVWAKASQSAGSKLGMCFVHLGSAPKDPLKMILTKRKPDSIPDVLLAVLLRQHRCRKGPTHRGMALVRPLLRPSPN